MTESERPRRARSKSPSLAPLYGGILIAILAVVAVALSKNAKEEQGERDQKKAAQKAAQESKSNPFEGIVSEDGVTPSKSSKQGSDPENDLPASPTDLLSNEIWQAAEENAAKGKDMLKSAYEADDAGNRPLYKERALAARDLYDLALDGTVDWEIEIVRAHGESDPRVARVQSARNKWFNQRKKLRKVEIKD